MKFPFRDVCNGALSLLHLPVNIKVWWYLWKRAFAEVKYFTYFQKSIKGFFCVLSINTSEPILRDSENRQLRIKSLQLLQFLPQWPVLLVNRVCAIVPVPRGKKNLSASRSNFNKFQFSLSKVKENISIDFWHKQLDQKHLLFLFQVPVSFFLFSLFLRFTYLWLACYRMNSPIYLLFWVHFSPYRIVGLCGAVIRWC